MTLREDILTEAPAAWFDTDGLAQPVTYKTAAGVEIATAAALQFGSDSAEQGRYLVEEMTALVPAADIAVPQNGDSVTLVDGSVWTVRKTKAGDALGIAWQLGLTRGERPTQRKVES
ncbi:MAG: hypothetical protein M1438_11620 [Deltaproteobacteria bacterium]|nr:hypothetical protein [Deltaproteobacteria bacterium]